MYKKAVASFWSVEEVDLSQDARDWERLTGRLPCCWTLSAALRAFRPVVYLGSKGIWIALVVDNNAFVEFCLQVTKSISSRMYWHSLLHLMASSWRI